jgi:hypothetical protein
MRFYEKKKYFLAISIFYLVYSFFIYLEGIIFLIFMFGIIRFFLFFILFFLFNIIRVF